MSMPSIVNVMNGPTTPRRMSSGSMPMSAVPVGGDEQRRDFEDLGPDVFEGVDDRHAQILAAKAAQPRSARGAFRGLPFLTVAPRPGSQRGPSSSSPSSAPGGRGGARRSRLRVDRVVGPVEAAEEPGGPRGSGALELQGVAQVAVVGDHQDRGGAVRAVGRARLVDQSEQDVVGRAAAAVADAQARTRSARRGDRVPTGRRRRHRWRPRRGTTPRRRPISAPRGAGDRRLRERVQQVGPVHEEPLRARERVGGSCGPWAAS